MQSVTLNLIPRKARHTQSRANVEKFKDLSENFSHDFLNLFFSPFLPKVINNFSLKFSKFLINFMFTQKKIWKNGILQKKENKQFHILLFELNLDRSRRLYDGRSFFQDYFISGLYSCFDELVLAFVNCKSMITDVIKKSVVTFFVAFADHHCRHFALKQFAGPF